MFRSIVLACSGLAVPLVGVGTASAAADPLLAPAGVCPGQASPGASARAQAGAMRCLINHARKRAGVRPLSGNRWLAASARAKVTRMGRCRHFSHSPCGAGPVFGLDTRRYRAAALSEVIYMGAGGGATPRASVAAWLRSPGHRRSLLNRRFRDVGVAVNERAVIDGRRVKIWTADLGVRR